MREFFKPWRRKLGVVMLGLACVFMVGWIRSFFAIDVVVIAMNPKLSLEYQSQRGRFVLATHQTRPIDGTAFAEIDRTAWWSERITNNDSLTDEQSVTLFRRMEDEWKLAKRQSLAGISYAAGKRGAIIKSDRNNVLWTQSKALQLPFANVVIPLTLLSAWLLLSKPRQTAPKTTEPAPPTGT